MYCLNFFFKKYKSSLNTDHISDLITQKALQVKGSTLGFEMGGLLLQRAVSSEPKSLVAMAW